MMLMMLFRNLYIRMPLLHRSTDGLQLHASAVVSTSCWRFGPPLASEFSQSVTNNIIPSPRRLDVLGSHIEAVQKTARNQQGNSLSTTRLL